MVSVLICHFFSVLQKFIMCETENMLTLSAKVPVKTPHFQCGGHEFGPWSGTKIPHVASLKKV